MSLDEIAIAYGQPKELKEPQTHREKASGNPDSKATLKIQTD
jgi:hypothetical protein